MAARVFVAIVAATRVSRDSAREVTSPAAIVADCRSAPDLWTPPASSRNVTVSGAAVAIVHAPEHGNGSDVWISRSRPEVPSDYSYRPLVAACIMADRKCKGECKAPRGGDVRHKATLGENHFNSTFRKPHQSHERDYEGRRTFPDLIQTCRW